MDQWAIDYGRWVHDPSSRRLRQWEATQLEEFKKFGVNRNESTLRDYQLRLLFEAGFFDGAPREDDGQWYTNYGNWVALIRDGHNISSEEFAALIAWDAAQRAENFKYLFNKEDSELKEHQWRLLVDAGFFDKSRTIQNVTFPLPGAVPRVPEYASFHAPNMESDDADKALYHQGSASHVQHDQTSPSLQQKLAARKSRQPTIGATNYTTPVNNADLGVTDGDVNNPIVIKVEDPDSPPIDQPEPSLKGEGSMTIATGSMPMSLSYAGRDTKSAEPHHEHRTKDDQNCSSRRERPRPIQNLKSPPPPAVARSRANALWDFATPGSKELAPSDQESSEETFNQASHMGNRMTLMTRSVSTRGNEDKSLSHQESASNVQHDETSPSLQQKPAVNDIGRYPPRERINTQLYGQWNPSADLCFRGRYYTIPSWNIAHPSDEKRPAQKSREDLTSHSNKRKGDEQQMSSNSRDKRPKNAPQAVSTTAATRRITSSHDATNARTRHKRAASHGAVSGDSWSRILSEKEDKNYLNHWNCFSREHLEVFEVQAGDSDLSRKGFRRPVIGQVGLRCRHCRIVKCYPGKLTTVYDSVAKLRREHLVDRPCTAFSSHMQALLAEEAKEDCSGSKDKNTRKYYAQHLSTIGIIETDGRLFRAT